MLLYAAALAAMFVCQNGLTRVIQAADGSTVTEQAPLFGDLIDAVKWYADREEGAAGEPPAVRGRLLPLLPACRLQQ